MNDKALLLDAIRHGLQYGTVTADDIKPLLQPTVRKPQMAEKHDKISAVDIMFYVAGLILFAAILSGATQLDGSGYTRQVVLTGGFGLLLWLAAFILLKHASQTDIRRGLTNAVLLTGSFSIISTGYFVLATLGVESDGSQYVLGAALLFAVSCLHLAFDRLVRRDLILLIGLLLATAAFPMFIYGLMQGSQLPIDILADVILIAAGLLAFSTRVVSRLQPDRRRVRREFDTLASFIALGTMYGFSFDNLGIVWQCGLIAGVMAIFYWSIRLQSRRLLGTASFFLILGVITISFRYFNGFGVTFSLIIATIGMLGSAAVAAAINRHYFMNQAR